MHGSVHGPVLSGNLLVPWLLLVLDEWTSVGGQEAPSCFFFLSGGAVGSSMRRHSRSRDRTKGTLDK